jgi:hypothetical protein
MAEAGRIGQLIRKKATKFREYNCVEPTDDVEQDYKTFLKCYFPDYKPDGHHAERFAKFLRCREAMLNWDPDTAGWSIGITHVCHMTDEEYNRMLNWNSTAPGDTGALYDEELHKLPMPRGDTVNWVTAGKVTAVKSQGSCGSCYAFAVTAALESYVAIKYNRLQDLSPQQYVDCSSNSGCGGGNSPTCYDYNLKKAKQNSWSCYTYVGYQQTCRYSSSCATQVGITNYYKVASGDEVAMANAVQKYGPVSVAYDVNGMNSYTGGVWDGSCSTSTNHLVAVVGYGTDDATGRPYWIYKNSWGTGWGEKGYARIIRGKNKCAIASWAYYATII